MARLLGLTGLMICVLSLADTPSWGHPRRTHSHWGRHYGGHSHVYVHHESLWNSPRGCRTPWFGRSSLSGFGSFGYSPYGFGYGFGFSPGVWINTYPTWGWSSGYYGYSGYSPFYLGSTMTGSLETPYLADLPDRGQFDNVEDENISERIPLKSVVRESRAKLIAKPESREWLPQTKTVKREGPAVDSADLLRSLRYQTEGDVLFRKQDYMNAYLMYSRSAVTAESRAEPRMRMGIALAGAGQWSRAVKEIRRGLDLDPELPKTGESLRSLFGSENEQAKSSLISGARQWAEENLGDTDRLFLIGVLLHFDDQSQSAAPFLQQVALANSEDHYAALFLTKGTETTGLRIVKRSDKPAIVADSAADEELPPPPAPGEGLDVPEKPNSIDKADKPAPLVIKRSQGPLFPLKDSE
ncbi:MAG: hypothetical protein ACKVT0_16525 [Planctomycetaceae bacterium]